MAGPVVMILLGIVLLLTTMRVLHPQPLLHWFGTYWPALIILWGVIKLVEYQQAQREGTRPAGIGAGGVLLLVFLIMFGMSATQASRFNWDEIRDHINLGDEDIALFGHNYSYEDQLQQDFPAGSSLRITSDRGAVNLTASNDNQIHVTAHKRINADSQGDADKYNPATKPQLMVNGNVITLNANTQGAGDRSVTTDMDISVPRKAAVVISARRGDVSVLGREGDVEIASQHGDIAASDITGKLGLNLSGASARVSNISGDVSVQGHADDVSLADVKGAAHISGEFDSIKLEKVAGEVGFKSARTDMEFSKLNGDLDMDSGDLRANDLIGPFRLLTRSKDVRLNGVDGDVRLENENGAVEIHMTRLGNMQLSNRNSDVQIYIPDKAGFQLDARARGGEIESDFSALKIDNGDDQASASGTVGAGGPRLVITNEHGGIELRKGSSLPEPPPVAQTAQGARRAQGAGAHGKLEVGSRRRWGRAPSPGAVDLDVQFLLQLIMIRSYKGTTPTIPQSCYVDDSAQLIGDVVLGEHASIWMNAVLRGDVHSIRVGAHSNVQDCSVLHGMKEQYGVFLGEYVTVGHSVTLHGCTIEDRCLIGMGSIILNGAHIGAGSIIAAGTLIPEKTIVEPGSLWMGSPGKFRRKLEEKDQETIMRYARNYLEYKDSYLREK